MADTEEAFVGIVVGLADIAEALADTVVVHILVADKQVAPVVGIALAEGYRLLVPPQHFQYAILVSSQYI